MPSVGVVCEAWALRGASWALSIGLHGLPAILGALTLGWQPWAGPQPTAAAVPVTIVWRQPVDPAPAGATDATQQTACDCYLQCCDKSDRIICHPSCLCRHGNACPYCAPLWTGAGRMATSTVRLRQPSSPSAVVFDF